MNSQKHNSQTKRTNQNDTELAKMNGNNENRETKESDYGYGQDQAFVFKPIENLREAIEKQEWFKGIILSALYIEHFGMQKLKSNFKGKISSDKFRNLDLIHIILLLFASNCIDQPTYTKMNDVRDKRNDIIHDVWEKLRINPNDAKSLIEKAIECIEKLNP